VKFLEVCLVIVMQFTVSVCQIR